MLCYEKTVQDGDGMELSHRKLNRLSDFDYNQNSAYFVTICTHERQKILSDIVGDGVVARAAQAASPARAIMQMTQVR